MSFPRDTLVETGIFSFLKASFAENDGRFLFWFPISLCASIRTDWDMFFRALVVSFGIVSGAGFSQFPEFSQQYLQRLGGAVDELSTVVSDFDRSAATFGMTRHQALDEMNGSPFLQRRQADLRRTISRYEDLSEAYVALRYAGPFTRFYEMRYMQDPELMSGTWRDYRPAVPLTFEGAVFSLLGFLIGYSALSAVAKILRPNRRRNKPTAA